MFLRQLLRTTADYVLCNPKFAGTKQDFNNRANSSSKLSSDAKNAS
jgi:hypothetical protein